MPEGVVHQLSPRPVRVNSDTGVAYECGCACGESFRGSTEGEAMSRASAHYEALGALSEGPSSPATPEPEAKPLAVDDRTGMDKSLDAWADDEAAEGVERDESAEDAPDDEKAESN